MKKFKSLLSLFLTYFKIGLFTFGGGYAMIPLIENEFVTKKKYLTESELAEIVAIAESTPGPIAINSATYIGYKREGFWGSLFCTLGVVLPSFIVIFIISQFLDKFMKFELVKKAFAGIQCGVGVLIVRAGYKMFKNMDKNALSVICFALCLCLMICVDIFSVNFSSIILILAGLVIGIGVTAINGKKAKEIKETNAQNGDGVSEDQSSVDEKSNADERSAQVCAEQPDSNENGTLSNDEKVDEKSVNEEESK